jgi:Bacteriophage related domain of unknown function
MTPSQARTTLESAFATGWGSRTPIAWGNTAPSMPDSSPWVRFTMIHAPARLRSWSANIFHYERPGIAFIQIFVPFGSGTRTSSDLQHAVMNILEGKKFGELETGTASIAEVGPGNTAMDQTQVRVEFVYEEQRIT